jgi:hypothetical protein
VKPEGEERERERERGRGRQLSMDTCTESTNPSYPTSTDMETSEDVVVGMSKYIGSGETFVNQKLSFVFS